MSQPSTLRQVLATFENATTPLSLPQIARELGISTEALDGMLQYWVRKGKLKESAATRTCGTCGSKDGCAFVLELPHSYELASPANRIDIPIIGGMPCGK